MTAHDPNLARAHGGLFGWLGLGSRQATEQPDSKVITAAAERLSTLQKHHVIEIVAFLGMH